MPKVNKRQQEMEQLFQGLEPHKFEMAKSLIVEYCFQEEELKKLKEIITKEGSIIVAKNGNGFDIIQEHPAKKSYDAMYRSYSATWSKLVDLLPKEDKNKDELMEFLNGSQQR